MIKKRWGFGIGTIFSLIVVYFIYLYSKQQDWAVLAFISKWYLIITAVILAIPLIVIVVVLLLTLFIFLLAALKLRWARKKHKKHSKNFVDADYKIKE